VPNNLVDPSPVRFGIFEVDLEAKELRKAGIRIRLQPQPFEILAILVSRPGQIVTREELQQKLWNSGTFVDFERSLNTAVKKLRGALNDDADTPRFIETIPRRGYRFIDTVIPIGVPLPEGEVAPIERKRIPAQWISASLLILLVLAGAAYLAFRHGPARQSTRAMLAVMPFESYDPKVEPYFVDGLTEELIAELGQLSPSSLGVIARTSAMHYKGTHQTIASIGRDLNVDYVVEGSVRGQDDVLRITVQLIRVSDQTHLWAHSYDRNLQTAFTLETELAQDIANEVRINVPDAGPLRRWNQKRHSANAEAEQLYLQGRFHLAQRYNESLKVARTYFQKAIDADPNYALAYSGLADADFVLSIARVEPAAETMPLAKAAALKATQLDDSLAEGHISRAQVLSNYEWNWAEAEREYRRGIELNPNYSTAHIWYGTYLMNVGRSTEAVAEIERALQVDPLSPLARTMLGKAYYYNRDFDKAIAQYDAVLKENPGFPIASSFLVQAYEQTGRFEDAIAESGRAIPLAGGDLQAATQITESLENAFKSRGPEGYWAKRLDAARGESSLEKAALYSMLNRKDEAFGALEQAYAQHDMWLVPLKVEPRWDNLRGDQRFDKLLKRVGLR
jgi:TolB-like protein/DNA-binding winged helix-turn-helix (wHTH) protein/Flp pilus assembly protein TadD